MGWYRNLRTNRKLLLAFGTLSVVMAVMGAIVLSHMGTIKANMESVYTEQMADVQGLMAMRELTHEIRATIYRALAARTPAETAAAMDRIKELAKLNAERRDKFAPRASAGELKEAFGQYRDAVAAYRTFREEAVFKPLAAGNRDAALDAMRDGDAKFQAQLQALSRAIALKQSVAQAKFEQSVSRYQVSRFTVVGLVVLSLALGVLFAMLVGRLIARPLAVAADVLTELAQGEGDLTRRLDATARDEIGDLGRAFNTFMGKLHDIIAQTRHTAGQVATASDALSQASQQLSAATQQQVASLEETAASLEEITATTRHNADNAQQANQLASGSRAVAEQGGQVVVNAVAAMNEINDSSRHIAEIITTIDEIAFQTNLLALNAAVEAARAGDQGRGFAVVAAEVRNLAQRSATAAREIKGLIQDSVHKVDAGSELVGRSGQVLTDIVTSVKRVSDIVDEIASASAEQSTGIGQVNNAVTQMDSLVQSSAAQTEELASTAQVLSRNAAELQALVGRFRLDTSVASERRPARVAAPPPPRAARRPETTPGARHTAAARRHTPASPRQLPQPVTAGATADSFEEF